ncbi:MAG: methyltransferase domain-containing protein [Patescibacteria group bacterium]
MHADCYHKMYEVEERHWWFRGKAAIAEMLLAQWGGDGKRVLDIGCGTGAFSKRLVDKGFEVTSLDVNPLALEYCRKRRLTNVVTGDAVALPFPDNSLDTVVALDILEHLDDDRAAAAEWMRVLAPGGMLLVTVPALSLLWGPQDEKLHHKRRYTASALRDVVGRGATVEKISYFNTLLFLPVFISRVLFRMFPRLLHDRDELDVNSPALNGFLARIFGLEARYLTTRNFPIGVSLLAIVRKTSGGSGMGSFEPGVQVARDHYQHTSYDHKARWLSYWYQIRAVLESKPQTVLEAGLGHGLVAQYLREQGVVVTTLDIDPNLKPDIVGSITAIPLPDNSVDCVLAAEVLEHIPFSKVPLAFRELRRVARNRAVVSVPDSRHTLLSVDVKVPLLPRLNIFLKTPSREEHVFDGQHYWEMGKRGYSFERIVGAIASAGFVIEKHFVPADCPTKHFFILAKA